MGNPCCKSCFENRKKDLEIQSYHPYDLPLGKLDPQQVEEKLRAEFVYILLKISFKF